MKQLLNVQSEQRGQYELNFDIDDDIRDDEFYGSDDESEPITTANTRSSPYHRDFLEIKVKVQIRASKCQNDYPMNNNRCLEFVQYLVDELLPDLPFWSIMLNTKKEHSCNSNAENHFKQVKAERELGLKAGVFIDKLFFALKAALQLLDLPPPIVCSRKRSGPKINEPNNMLSEESWKDCKKQRKSSRLSYQNSDSLKKNLNLEIKKKALIVNDNNKTINNKDYYFCDISSREYFVAWVPEVRLNNFPVSNTSKTPFQRKTVFKAKKLRKITKNLKKSTDRY
ncbi:hypothetical protein EVAR_80195_1 [Eumeta japonica]|uniref:Uncharacterized protein n=1 Tax=Eumeta variegata TaxID=151549 RepID=A0A4C1UB74_EUMVA|nr:hypothetical protein EVAR_80195_1 [Eumeta japonica]